MDIIDYGLFGDLDFWWFKGKNDLITLLIKKLSAKKQRIADIGCGTGDLLVDLRNTGYCCGIDTNTDALKIALSKSRNLIMSNAEMLGLKSNVFDAVVIADVLEHIEDDFQALREVVRIVKPTGFILLSVPAFSGIYSSHDKALKHYRRYNCSDILHLIRACKLELMYKTYWNFTTFLPLASIRLLKRLINYKPRLQKTKIPNFVNRLLGMTITLENKIIEANLSLPIGLSLYLVLRK